MAIFLLQDLGKTAHFFDKGPESGLACTRRAVVDIRGQALTNARTTVEFISTREMFWVYFLHEPMHFIVRTLSHEICVKAIRRLLPPSV